MTHRLLQRQLKKLKIQHDQPPDGERWSAFLENVERSYEEADNDRYLLERSLAISSREMQELYEDLKDASEERYRVIFEGVHDAIFVETCDGKILNCNSRACEMFGFQRDQLVNMNVIDLVPTEQTDVIRESLSQPELPTTPLLTQNKRANGELFPVEITFRKQVINDQDVILAVVRDISERKRAEEAMRISEARYQAIVEDQTEFINRYTPDGMITFVNAAYARLHNTTPEDLIGKTHIDFIPKKTVEEIKELHKRITPEAPVSTSESQFITEEGEVMWLQWRDRAIFDDEGQILEYQGVGRDITERVRAEEALKESEEKFRTLAEKSPNMIFINRGGRIVYANEACTEIMGYTRDEFYNPDFSFLSLFDETFADEVKGYFKQHSAGEDVPPYVSKLVTKDGARLDAIHATRVIRYAGEPAILGIVTDVTERKRAEEAIARRAAEMNVLNEIGGRIASVLDLNNVLNLSVDLIHKHFKYPHVGLFLLEHGSGDLILKARAGEYQGLPEGQHKLSLGQGIVGWAAKSGKTLVSGDVAQEPRYINLYPDQVHTQSEMSLPITVGERVLGVLDIQSELKEAFGDQDLLVMQTLVDQVAAAIENARLYEAVQHELRERKRAESQLMLQSAALESAANAIVITDRDANILWVNHAFCELTGYAAEEVIRQNTSILRSHAQDKAFYKEMWDTILAGRTWQGNLINRRKDGSLYHEELTITPVHDDQNEISHFIAIKQDISERRATEERIQRQAEDLQLINALNEHINQGEPLGKIVEFLSKETMRIYNSLGTTMYLLSDSRRFLQSQNLSLPDKVINLIESNLKLDIRQHRMRVKEDTAIAQVLDTCKPLVINEEQHIISLYKELVSLVDLPIHDIPDVLDVILPPVLEVLNLSSLIMMPLVSKGNPIGILLMGRKEPFAPEDLARITSLTGPLTNAIQRKQSEEALRLSVANYQTIFEGVQDAILVEDMSGNILDANVRACEMYDYDHDILLSLNVRDLVPEGRPVVLPEKMVERGIADQVIETYNRRSDGEAFPVEISTRLQDMGDQPVMLIVVRDMTEARQAQRKAQLQDRLAAVGQLAAGIAHDFNNILGTIILYSELLLNNEMLEQKDRERIETIFKQAQRGSTLTSQVLDFSRRSVMEKHALNLVPFLQDLEKLLSRTIPEAVKLSIDYNGGQSYIVNADPTRMQQVFLNLALNARDAMPKGGELKISLNQIDVDEVHPPYPGMKSGAWVQICVSDNGHGIAEDVMPHIFEPFFTTKPQGKGTGLGLAQVYGIVKQHEGYIDAESMLDQGTTFSIFIPALESITVENVPSALKGERSGEGECILVVEDDESTRVAICEILNAMGYAVLDVADGVEALDVLAEKNGQIDLILSDLVMPNMGGRDLYDTVTERHPEIKVILMTGYPLGGHTRELLDRSRVTWLQKPLSSEAIARAVKDMLAGQPSTKEWLNLG
jgi:PAS domain S-box-containing protein